MWYDRFRKEADMELNHRTCYDIIKSKDSRFDGLFFTAVKTTGIYCRPVCKVPAPKPENCTFYRTATEAEANGYRPCLRCRPEMAPKYSDFNQGEQLLGDILQYFEREGYQTGLVQKSAAYFGISTRHLRRLFQTHFGVSPNSYIMTQRLLRAKLLLVDTRLPVQTIVTMTGFGSVARFNAAFKAHYRLTPSQLRKQSKETKETIELKLPFRPPYNWNKMIAFYAKRTVKGVESVVNNTYRRSIRMKKTGQIYRGWLTVSMDTSGHALRLTISENLSMVILEIIQLVRAAFDLDLSPEALPSRIPKDTRLPGCFDDFEMSVRAILGQQITVKAAHTLAGRLVEKLGDRAETPFDEINRFFPTPQQILADDHLENTLGELGIIKTRSRSIHQLALKMSLGELKLKKGEDPDQVKAILLSIDGIGPWTAEYLTMRGLSWPDAFPVADIGIKHGLHEHLKDEDGSLILNNEKGLSKYKLNKAYQKAALAYSEQFRPWRSYLTISLWHSLSEKG